MAVCRSASSTQNFSDAVLYALSKLGTPHLVLKDEQRRSIIAVYNGKDVFVCLPTGFGKSICFQSLPFLFDHKLGRGGGKGSAVVVISPLIALMVDQVQSLRDRGVHAVVVSSGSRDKISKEFLASDESLKSASLIFCSPEALTVTKWRDALEKPDVSDRVCALVVDEVHCVSKW